MDRCRQRVFPGIPPGSTSGMDFSLRYEKLMLMLGEKVKKMNSSSSDVVGVGFFLPKISTSGSLESGFTVVNSQASGCDISELLNRSDREKSYF